MQNDASEFMDLYALRKCSASNRVIGAKDHASIQMNVAEVDKVAGRFNGQFKSYATCGAVGRMGESDVYSPTGQGRQHRLKELLPREEPGCGMFVINK
nr:small ribosomal subunit protein eS21-like [Kogia breviceps]